VVCIALIVGGIWALYRFQRIDERIAEQQTFQQAQVDINITATQENLDSGEMCIVATVQITR
jgi:hypothetical protein